MTASNLAKCVRCVVLPLLVLALLMTRPALGQGPAAADQASHDQATATPATGGASAPAAQGQPATAAPAGSPAVAAAAESSAAAAAADAAILAAACADKTDGPPPPAKLARVQGTITSPDADMPQLSLIVVEKATSNRYAMDRGRLKTCAAADGGSRRFAYWLEVPPGTYDLTLSAAHCESETSSSIVTAANEIKQEDFNLVKADEGSNFWFLCLLPIGFLVSIWVVRWNNIAKPSRLGVIRQLQDLRRRLPPASAASGAGQELDDAQSGLSARFAPLDWLFWSRGQELAGWNLIHKVDVDLLAEAKPEQINARLASMQQRLTEIDKAGAKNLVDRIGAELKCDPSKSDPEARRQLLVEASSYLYDYNDTDFASLTSWQNKAFWLTTVGVGLILSVGLAEGHPSLFLAGAVGGFLSRLTRELKRADVPNDYGASWSTLFLSPVAGAIAGWFGIALIMLLNDPTVGMLAGPLKLIGWDMHNVPATLGAAFLLGFSERLFDGIVSQLEDSIDKKKDDSEKATSKAPPPPSPPPPPPASADAAGVPPPPPSTSADATGALPPNEAPPPAPPAPDSPAQEAATAPTAAASQGEGPRAASAAAGSGASPAPADSAAKGAPAGPATGDDPKG
jgi:hypothetical protein